MFYKIHPQGLRSIRKTPIIINQISQSMKQPKIITITAERGEVISSTAFQSLTTWRDLKNISKELIFLIWAQCKICVLT